MIIFFLPAISPHYQKKRISEFIFTVHVGEKNAFIFYQKKEDGKLDRDHRSKEETLSFGDKKLD